MENFIYTWQIEDSVCDGLIDYFHQNNEHKSDGTISLYNESKIRKDIKESTDVMFYNQSKDERILNYFNCLRKGHAAYCDKYNL